MKKLGLSKETLYTLSSEEVQTVGGALFVVGITHGYCSNQHSICACPSWGSGCTIVTAPDATRF
jgi:hypothetical protein